MLVSPSSGQQQSPLQSTRSPRCGVYISDIPTTENANNVAAKSVLMTQVSVFGQVA